MDNQTTTNSGLKGQLGSQNLNAADITEKYFKLLTAISISAKARKKNPSQTNLAVKFEENPRLYLTNTSLGEIDGKEIEPVGMTLPDHTVVRLDPHISWPTVYLYPTSKKEKDMNLITITEDSMQISTNWGEDYNWVPTGAEYNTLDSLMLHGDDCYTISNIPGKPEDYFILLIMPYPSPGLDQLTNICFASGDPYKPEIVLSCC